MTKNDPRPLVPYLRQSRAKEWTISIDEQRRDIQRWAAEAGVTLAPIRPTLSTNGSARRWRAGRAGNCWGAMTVALVNEGPVTLVLD